MVGPSRNPTALAEVDPKVMENGAAPSKVFQPVNQGEIEADATVAELIDVLVDLGILKIAA